MLKTYSRQIYRDRRRIGVAIWLNTGASYFGGNTLPDPIPLLPTELFVGAFFFLMIPIVSIAMRRWRHLTEIVSLANLIATSLAWSLPGTVFSYNGTASSLFPPIAIYLATIYALNILLYGAWSDVLTPKANVTAATRLRSTASVRSLWYGLIALPGHLDSFADPDVVSVDYADPSHRVVRLLRWQVDGRPGESLMHIDEIEPQRYIRVRNEVLQGPRDSAAEGTTEFFFRDTGKRREVLIRFHGGMIAPRRALKAWLDDTMGRMFDVQIRGIERGICRRSGLLARDSYDAFFDANERVGLIRADIRGAYRTAYGRELSDREAALLDI